VESKVEKPPATIKPKNLKINNASESLLNIDSQLNNRVIGSMRLGSFNLNKESDVYRSSGASTYR